MDEDKTRATNIECVVEQAWLIKWHNTKHVFTLYSSGSAIQSDILHLYL